VLAATCSKDHGRGLQVALARLARNADRSHRADEHPKGTRSDTTPGGIEGHRGGDGGRPGGHAGEAADGNGGGGSHSVEDAGAADSTQGIDVVHGKGRDGEHGKDKRGGESASEDGVDGKGGGGRGGSSPGGGRAGEEHGNGGSNRPAVVPPTG
jgi:hypothetical protein